MVNFNDIPKWIEGVEPIGLIIFGGCLIALFIGWLLLRKAGVEKRIIPPLKIIDQEFFVGKKHYTKQKFLTGGKEFDTRSKAYDYAKSISKKAR